MALSFRGKINPSQLIEEVKKRPCLYDGRGTHNNHDTKNAAWGEIALALFQNQWHEFSPADKDCLVKDMQVKWKSLRDNFSRQLRIQKQGNSANPQKKYIYMDQLSFLKPHFLKRDKISLSDDSKDSIDSLINSCDDTKLLPNVSSSSVELPEDFISQSTLRFVPIQPKSKPFVPAVTPIEITSYNQHYEPSSAEPPMKKVARCLEELTNFHKEMKSDDPMGNKKFLLSLLPFMKKLPDDVNLEVRLQLMGVLETYVNGKN